MARCDCCGCLVESDYGTSFVEGDGSSDDPFVISIVDPDWVRPAARIRRTTNQLIATGATFAPVSFDTIVFEEGGEFFNVLDPTFIRIPIDGIYIFGACGMWAANATGTRELALRLDATTIIATSDQTPDAVNGATATPWMEVTYQYRLGPGNTIEVVARQESGGNLNLTAEADDSIVFWIVYAGKVI